MYNFVGFNFYEVPAHSMQHNAASINDILLRSILYRYNQINYYHNIQNEISLRKTFTRCRIFKLRPFLYITCVYLIYL